ncbi:MAG: hypothetical protein M3Q40_07590 [Pseudomonadota bacterium]|nr:hypothetical protein [Pseudomonadota bacterium]
MLEAIAGFKRHVEAADPRTPPSSRWWPWFAGPADTDAAHFEALLWSQPQRLHDLDVARGTA